MLLEDVTRFRLLDEVKSNLVATVSHELKTPLTSIRLVLHLLLEESVGPLVPKQMELLVDARDNAERLLAMINNLLDLARARAGAEPARAAAAAALAGVAGGGGGFRPRSADRGVGPVLDCGDLEPVAVDAEQFQHALAEPAGQRPGAHPAGRAHHAGGPAGQRPGGVLGDRYGLGDSRRVPAGGFREVFPRARRQPGLLAFARMDGAKKSSVQIAIVKAHSAAIRRKPSGPALSGDKTNILVSLSLAIGSHANQTPLRGGLPLEVDGECVGAIGVSNGSEEEDLDVARAGAAALAKA